MTRHGDGLLNSSWASIKWDERAHNTNDLPSKLTYLYSLVDIATKRQDLDLFLG